VIVDHTNRRVLDVLASREKAHVADYLRQKRQEGLLAEVVEVTCDMWDAYANAAKEVFGETCRVVIDRFHVMKNFQDQLTNARREIQRRLRPEDLKVLKGTRWLWLKNEENLTVQEQQELDGLKERFPELKQLAEQRENLRAIFEDRTIMSVEEGRKQLMAWMAEAVKLGLKGLATFCKTLSNWMDQIAGYFVSRSSNRRTEGFNHGLRSILWRAFGMTNFRRFRLRVLDRFGRPAND